MPSNQTKVQFKNRTFQVPNLTTQVTQVRRMIQLVDRTQFIFAMYSGLQWTLSLTFMGLTFDFDCLQGQQNYWQPSSFHCGTGRNSLNARLDKDCIIKRLIKSIFPVSLAPIRSNEIYFLPVFATSQRNPKIKTLLIYLYIYVFIQLLLLYFILFYFFLFLVIS